MIVYVWGDFSVREVTLRRFFSFHYVLPLLILVLIVVHILLLHLVHSRSPVWVKGSAVKFDPFFSAKDIFLLVMIVVGTLFLVFWFPIFFLERDMFLPANPMMAPEHIVPE